MRALARNFPIRSPKTREGATGKATASQIGSGVDRWMGTIDGRRLPMDDMWLETFLAIKLKRPGWPVWIRGNPGDLQKSLIFGLSCP